MRLRSLRMRAPDETDAGKTSASKMSSIKTINELHFLPKSGIISGLDVNAESALAILLETLLAAYCRVDTYLEEASVYSLTSVAQEVPDREDPDKKRGIYHFALPAGARDVNSRLI